MSQVLQFKNPTKLDIVLLARFKLLPRFVGKQVSKRDYYRACALTFSLKKYEARALLRALTHRFPAIRVTRDYIDFSGDVYD